MVLRVHVCTIKIFKWTRILIVKKISYIYYQILFVCMYSTCTIEISNELEIKSSIEDLYFSFFPFQRTVMVPSPICYVVSAPWRELL